MAHRLLRAARHIVISVIALSALAGCVSSEGPVLEGQSQQPFGASARFQFYSLRNGVAHDPSILQLHWEGSRYMAVGRDMHKDHALMFYPLDGKGLVIQAIDGRPGEKVEYAVLRQVADGVYLVNPVDDDDADAATRAKFCPGPSGCRVTTAEQVMGLARATLAKHHERGALAIRIADDK